MRALLDDTFHTPRAWILMMVTLLVTVAAGLWHVTGRGIVSWVVCLPVVAIPWVIAAVIFNRRLAPATRTYHFAE